VKVDAAKTSKESRFNQQNGKKRLGSQKYAPRWVQGAPKSKKNGPERKEALHKADFPFLIFLSPTTTLKMRARLKDECAARL
jgi:hypothetical protein